MNIQTTKPSIARRGLILTISIMLVASSWLVLPAAPAQAAACAAPATDYGSATASVTLPAAATYRVWSRIMVPDTTNTSYLLEIDGAHCFSVGGGQIQPNTWLWVDYQDGSITYKVNLALSQGAHTIKIIGKQPGVKFDRVVFTSDPNCTPAGNGDNCNAPTDTTLPTVNLTAPAENATVGGKVNITANASDNVGVRQVDFFVNSTPVATDTTAPYSAEWNTANFPNATATVIAKAYDTAGNTNTSSRTVTVFNQTSDTQAPSQPAGLTVVAPAYNKADIKWQASTDNIGVTKYKILRNGSPLAEVGPSPTTYQDTGLLPSTTYRYKVIALDAAGNASVASAEVSVTTPPAPDTEPPTTPTGVNAVGVSSKQITVSWAPSTDNIGVKEYEVFRSQSGGTAQKVATIATTSYGDTGLSPSTEYSYSVKAKDTAGNTSAASNTVTAKTTDKKRNSVVRGEVHGTQGSHLKGALVEIAVPNAKYTATTNRNGRYVIRDIPRGKYTFTFTATDYQSKSLSRNISQATIWQEVTLRKK